MKYYLILLLALCSLGVQAQTIQLKAHHLAQYEGDEGLSIPIKADISLSAEQLVIEAEDSTLVYPVLKFYRSGSGGLGDLYYHFVLADSDMGAVTEVVWNVDEERLFIVDNQKDITLEFIGRSIRGSYSFLKAHLKPEALELMAKRRP